MIPLYGFLEGDTIGLVVLARAEDTAAELAHRLQEAASVRVRPFADPRVVFDGVELPPKLTVGAAGMKPLDRFDVARATSLEPTS